MKLIAFQSDIKISIRLKMCSDDPIKTFQGVEGVFLCKVLFTAQFITFDTKKLQAKNNL